MKTSYAAAARWGVGLLAGALLATASQASLELFSQPPLIGGRALLSGSGVDDNQDPVVQQSAESFRLSEARTIKQFIWWGTDLATTGFDVRLVAGFSGTDDGSNAGLAGGIEKFDIGRGYYRFELTLDSVISASANVDYYLMIWGGAASWGWLESEVGDGTSGFRDGGDGNQWFAIEPDLSLLVVSDVDGTVPEPGALALSALALAALAASSRRRRVH